MSHYVKSQPAFLVVNEKEFVAALEKHFGQGKVEVHDDPKDLVAYTGALATDNSRDYLKAEKCHVIVRKETLAEKLNQSYVSSNDLGYRRAGEKYDSFIDDMGFGEEAQLSVLKDYTELVANKEMLAAGFYAEGRHVNEHGEVELVYAQY